MNQDQVKGTWDQIKGRAKRAWGELTGDESKKAEGSQDKLHGTIEKGLGDAKEVVQDTIDKIHLS